MKKTLLFFFTGCIVGALLFATVFHRTNQTIIPQHDQSLIQETVKVLDVYLPRPSSFTDALLGAVVSSYGDVYTTYFAPEDVEQFNTMIQGDFEGIGAYIEDGEDSVFVAGTLPGSPAEEAGLLPGDIIQTVDGVSVHNKTSQQVVTLIRGPANTPVVLEIFSTALSLKKSLTLFRKQINIPILTDSLNENILHLHLLSFNDHSATDIKNILKKYEGRYTHILLDLRNNGGGTIESAVDVGSIFLDPDLIISTVEGVDNTVYVSHSSQNTTTPISLLVNGQTASAAEILASALRAHNGAIIYGTKTYGKGSVQQLYPLSNGGQLKVTTAHWKTAENELLDHIGITPDEIIPPTLQSLMNKEDEQLQKTIDHIKNTSITSL